MIIPLEWMPPIMFAGLVIFMIIGYPVAFSLCAVGFFFGFLAIDFGYFTMAFMQAIPGRVFGSILANELLLAIPFFTFMGAILEKCGLAEDMLDSMGQLFGTVRGGLGYSVIIVGFILGAITGTVAGQVIAMALISLPVMIRYGYSQRLATGVIAAAGTITQVIPPSLVLIVLADQLGRSVGDMYKGAMGPSIAQTLLFLIYIFIMSRLRPQTMPPLPPEARTLHGWALWGRVIWGMVPSVVLSWLYSYQAATFVPLTLDATLVIAITFLGTTVGAAILPWRKPEIYNASPIARYKVLGLPLITFAVVRPVNANEPRPLVSPLRLNCCRR